MPRRPTRGRSNRPTRRDIAREVEQQSETDADADEAEAVYAALVAKAAGTATDAERERWEQADQELKDHLTGRVHDELLAGMKAAHSGGEH